MAGPDEPPREEAAGTEIAPGVRVLPEVLRFSFSQSGGPGGQNVNKRATRAELRLRTSELPIPGDARERLEAAAGRRMTDEGELVITSEVHRSQARNRAECLERLRELLVRALVRPRRRRRTRPTRGSIERRLTEKKQTGQRKRSRRASEDGE